MTHSYNQAVAARKTLDVRAQPASARVSRKPGRRELESKLAELQRNYAELATSIFEAAQVHRRLCAPRLLHFGEFEIASEIFAVRQLPGDFFSVESVGDEVVFALGDVCGKGLAAGMWTPHLVGLVRAHTDAPASPPAIVAAINRDVCRTPLLGPLASIFLAKLNTMTGVLDYCSAGHPPAFLLRANGELELLTEGGLLLGVLEDAEYVSGACALQAGDTLMIYSDGITESRNRIGEEFGNDRLEEQLRQAQSGPADGALFSVLGAVQDFAATRPLIDDMALAIIRRD